MPSKYRKKPIVIEAILWDGEPSTVEALLRWSSGDIHYHADGYIVIDTLEGRLTASLGDYIIKGVQGEVYPCKPDIFEATYEAVE